MYSHKIVVGLELPQGLSHVSMLALQMEKSLGDCFGESDFILNPLKCGFTLCKYSPSDFCLEMSCMVHDIKPS